MAQQECTDFQFKHETLKEILEELGKLHNTESTKKNVFNHLKGDLGTYCAEAYLTAFYKDDSYGSSSGYIQLLTDAGKRISEAILLKASWDDRYVDPHVSHKDQDCAVKIANALKACLPKTFPALFFLFFNLSTDCVTIKGGDWYYKKVKDIREKLGEWLTQDSGSDLIPRKFSEKELNDKNTGKDVAEKLKKAVSLTLGQYDGALQKVLCGSMFVCEWNDALLGHALCFLAKFCSKVNNKEHLDSQIREKIKGYFEAFGDICQELVSPLERFNNGSDSLLYAVCQKNTGLFDDIWDDGKFEHYVKWLKENLPKIIQSLNTMSSDCKKWDSGNLQSAMSAGPFRFGFVFMDNKWEDDTFKTVLESPISKLTGPGHGFLHSLKNALQTSSPGSAQRQTAGASVGVISLGGAGAGVAYGFNLFGLKDIMSGVFGAIRGLVVGF